MRVTVLGCGHSGGTPLIGGDWGACDPENSRNRRLRPSILVQQEDTRILVDTSPDLRQQLLNADVDRLDAILYTHAHADHLHGLDDLRAINRIMQADIPAYADADTWHAIETRFEYVVTPLRDGTDFYYKPQLTPHIISPGDKIWRRCVDRRGIRSIPRYVAHRRLPVRKFCLFHRFGRFAGSQLRRIGGDRGLDGRHLDGPTAPDPRPCGPRRRLVEAARRRPALFLPISATASITACYRRPCRTESSRPMTA